PRGRDQDLDPQRPGGAHDIQKNLKSEQRSPVFRRLSRDRTRKIPKKSRKKQQISGKTAFEDCFF
ncbi:MAG: hypothetical protein II184_05515, partial [Clostridia bacterium]|nr:hypothetical protein [Clostridia bacterium]